MKKIILIILLFTATIPLSDAIHAQRLEKNYIEASGKDAVKPSEFGSTILLSGLRPLVIDMVWLRTGYLEENNKWVELKNLMDILGKLQPNNEQVWVYAGWNMAYNIAINQDSEEEAYKWIIGALEHLDEGLKYNPNSPDIHFQMAQTIYDRICSYQGNLALDRYFPKEFLKNKKWSRGEHPFLTVVELLDKAIEYNLKRNEMGLINSSTICLTRQARCKLVLSIFHLSKVEKLLDLKTKFDKIFVQENLNKAEQLAKEALEHADLVVQIHMEEFNSKDETALHAPLKLELSLIRSINKRFADFGKLLDSGALNHEELDLLLKGTVAFLIANFRFEHFKIDYDGYNYGSLKDILDDLGHIQYLIEIALPCFQQLGASHTKIGNYDTQKLLSDLEKFKKAVNDKKSEITSNPK